MTQKEQERYAKLRAALRTIRQEIKQVHQTGESKASYAGIEHIDHIAEDALFDSAQYPTNRGLSDN